MRIMSDAREAAWGVVQGAISELDFDFGTTPTGTSPAWPRRPTDPRLQEWLRWRDRVSFPTARAW